MLKLDIPKGDKNIYHQQKILSMGSCFTEHIGNALQELKFDVLQNPNGILFDPVSVCNSLISYIHNDQYSEADLFPLHELWHSWQHHSRFSSTDKATVLQKINAAQDKAHHFLKQCDWLIITLGSSFSYRLLENAAENKPALKSYFGGTGVANCHRAPAQWFNKHLLAIDETVTCLDNTIHRLVRFNPKLNIIFTISPVRHIRDGVVANNRSKARLLEAVHHLVQKFDRLHYFPAYELVVDVLRDYRFYDIDLVHPNYAATEFVLDHFLKAYTTPQTQVLAGEIKKIVTARKHKIQHPGTQAHMGFLKTFLQQATVLQQQHPYVNLQSELDYFADEIELLEKCFNIQNH